MLSSLLLGSLLCLALAPPSSQALNWTSTRTTPAFSVEGGERIRGVNLGGWFVLENWMQSDLFAVPPLDESTVSDEWTYTKLLGKTEAKKRLTAHWASYITEDDFAAISAADLNSVRIPIPYWALIDLETSEPYVQGQLVYLGKALEWALKYNLDVLVDLHGVPGSQNAFDNSGHKVDTGPSWGSSKSNVDRSLEALGVLTAFLTAPKYEGVVKAIEVLNEPIMDESGAWGATWDRLSSFYVDAYNTVRSNETIITGNPKTMIVFHDAFQPIANWDFFFTDDSLGGSFEQFGLDTHIYSAFNGDQYLSHEEHLSAISSRRSSLKTSNSKWTTLVGEMSLGVQIYCTPYSDCLDVTMASQIDNSTSNVAFMKDFWGVQKEVFEETAGWFFWSWKTDAAAPWSLKQSLASGWIAPLPERNITTTLATTTTSAALPASTSASTPNATLTDSTSTSANSTLLQAFTDVLEGITKGVTIAKDP